MNKRNLHLIIIALWGLVCWLFFGLCYRYHFFYQEQNQLFLLTQSYIASYMDRPAWLAQLAGDFLTQFYYYLYLGPVILTLCLLLMATLLRCCLRKAGVGAWLSTILSLMAMTVMGIFYFRVEYRLSALMTMIGWLSSIWLLLLIWKKNSWKLALPVTIATAALAYWCLGAPKMGKLKGPDLLLEKIMAVDNEYYWGNYQRVEQLVEQSNPRSEDMMYFYYLVQARKGELPDKLLKYEPHQLGTFYKIGPETPRIVINNMNELYWVLGDMTFTERAALMASVFSADNRNARMMKRLAECNLVSGDTAAAEKYLRILDKTLAYKGWVDHIRKNQDALLQQKRAMQNRQDTIALSDNAHFIMMQLLDSNADNTVALDYLLCSDLLLKDISNFKRDYDRYCTEKGRERLKPLYQEALCIWLAGTQATEEEWSRYVKDRNVLQRFAEYSRQRGSSRYKDTYWYYFDKKKAPKP